MTELFLKIEEAENRLTASIEIHDAICELTQHTIPTEILLNNFQEQILSHEKLWREIENRVDYQAKYTSREHARADFLKEYFQRR